MYSSFPCPSLLDSIVPLQLGPGCNAGPMAGRNRAGHVVIHWQDPRSQNLTQRGRTPGVCQHVVNGSQLPLSAREPARQPWLNTRNSGSADPSYSSNSTTSPILRCRIAGNLSGGQRDSMRAGRPRSRVALPRPAVRIIPAKTARAGGSPLGSGAGRALPSRLPARPLALRAAKGKRAIEQRVIISSAGGSPGRRSGSPARARRDSPTGSSWRRRTSCRRESPAPSLSGPHRIRQRATWIAPIPVTQPLPYVTQHVVQPKGIRSLPPCRMGATSTILTYHAIRFNTGSLPLRLVMSPA